MGGGMQLGDAFTHEVFGKLAVVIIWYFGVTRSRIRQHWKVGIIPCVHQSNGSDCGEFAVLEMDCVLSGRRPVPGFDYHVAEARERMHEILMEAAAKEERNWAVEMEEEKKKKGVKKTSGKRKGK
jgi:hypothetical protein